MTHPLALLAAYLLGVVAVGRATRLVVHDPYPPIQAVRTWWVGKQAQRDWDTTLQQERTGPAYGWGSLVECPFCAAPYITAVTLAVAIWGDVWTPDLTTVGGWWLVLAVWASVSYLAAMLVLRDEPAED